tara:strand:- start:2032 stop:2826 length:795 start_codon:yes stop_codon:yes gene_type:complete
MSQSDDKKASKIAITEDSDNTNEKKEIKYTEKTIDYVRKYPELVCFILAIILIAGMAKMANDELGPLKPSEINLAEMEEYEERKVKVKATVSDAYRPSSGVWIVDITDDSINGTRLLFSNSLNFIPKTGDIIEASGEVSRYNGELEIISQANDVKMISRWGENNITIGDIANEPNYYEGKTVIINTYVKSNPTFSYGKVSFTVGETYHNVRVEVNETDFRELYGDPVLIIGDHINLVGILKFDTYWFSYEIILEDETHKLEIII